ncbi:MULTISPECIES: TIGR02680 family protein [unclassified Actinopolyspora]|uniref:TIGR02680 family protein n=1 Tax=unclassified Actinopolyspora TaxID=2639451 RepID=UPI0013F60C11|nr:MULTISPECIES: TIGR02680 family protein [unclassified Actinopolyspora]NHD16210.1 TIGR02680 family protein [Actinopolyspora sp. BKK2]NHE75927.1 TIGR02680 family protein [Actinopolyspora sp. BKK1]
MSVTELPTRNSADTARSRWQPNRAGIVNVWRYYQETFRFHRGRLLLRGPNGTGKSKALELLLPFLFDARLTPKRLSTFGSDRGMHWNLMGEGTHGTTRVGYVWMEFTRETPEGAEWFCCGARLQASSRTSNVTTAYFTTTRRIHLPDSPVHDTAEILPLLNDSGQPLSQAALGEALGGSGQVHQSPSDYRTELRSRLFGNIGQQRYESLISALLQLRTPKLSERLDPKFLSDLLSSALPPLGDAEISELADGFERLDRQRERVGRLAEEVEAAEKLAERQQQYARRVLYSAAAELTSANTEVDRTSGIARETQRDYDDSLAERERLRRSRSETEGTITNLREEFDGLNNRNSELSELATDSENAHNDASELRSKATEARALAEEHERNSTEAAEHALRAETERQEAADTAGQSAWRIGMSTTHREMAASEHDSKHARNLLRAAVGGKRKALDELYTALHTHETALRDHEQAEQRTEQERTELAAATERREAAEHEHATAVLRQAQRLRDWAGGNTELRIDDVEELAEAAEDHSTVQRLVRDAAEPAAEVLTTERTRTRARRDDLAESRAAHVAEIERLRHETDLPPAAPTTRDADRTALPGAPLWKLVDFAERTDEATRTGVEAALQASGLLDAWVTPDGKLTPDGHDTFLTTDSPVSAGGRTLAEVLRPEPEHAVPARRLERILAAIAFDERLPAEHPVAIGADGHWRLGPATGSWAKPAVAHIGTTARERARQQRMAELSELITELDHSLAATDEALAELERRRERLRTERDSLPSAEEIETARGELDTATAAVAARQDAVTRGERQVAEYAAAVERTRNSLAAKADEHGLPRDRAALQEFGNALEGFERCGESWIDAMREATTAEHTARDKAAQAERSLTIAQQRENEAERAEQRAATLATKLRARERALGAEQGEILRELENVRGRLRQAESESESLNQQLEELSLRIGSLESSRVSTAQDHERAVGLRNDRLERFRRIAATSIPGDAGIELDASSNAIRTNLESARSVTDKWPNTPHTTKNINDSLDRLNETVHGYREVLAEHAAVALELDEDVHVFVATMNGVRLGATQLLESLRAEHERQRTDITEHEHELFDKTLTGDVRRHLAERIRSANELVDAMNDRLERVRTASDVAVRLVWQVGRDLPAGTQAARDLLLKDPVRLSEQDRESLHRFFRERIEDAKANNTATSWEEQLREVFDYTRWHRFDVKIDRGRDRGWELLTRKLHGALSGGEKAIALHLPLFAAVAAHYESMTGAPRMILLDEVFVGVDSANRGQVFELLNSLELDLMLTSDHEWGTYRELDGIAIHALTTGDGDEAVTTTRFVWDGEGWSE